MRVAAVLLRSGCCAKKCGDADGGGRGVGSRRWFWKIIAPSPATARGPAPLVSCSGRRREGCSSQDRRGCGPGGRRCVQRIAPIVAAMNAARKGFRAELLPLQGVLQTCRHSIASIPSNGFRSRGEALAFWSFRFDVSSNPPDSFEGFPPPPIPKFEAVDDFVSTGGYEWVAEVVARPLVS